MAWRRIAWHGVEKVWHGMALYSIVSHGMAVANFTVKDILKWIAWKRETKARLLVEWSATVVGEGKAGTCRRFSLQRLYSTYSASLHARLPILHPARTCNFKYPLESAQNLQILAWILHHHTELTTCSSDALMSDPVWWILWLVSRTQQSSDAVQLRV